VKKLYIILILILNLLQGSAQNRNNKWLLSYEPFVYDCGIDFSSGLADTFSVWKNLEFFFTNASICDTLGELLFYTNGIFANNRDHDTLQNSKNYNPGYATEYYGSNGLGITQGVLIIPQPDNIDYYFLFHESADIAEIGNAQPLSLRYSLVDMELDNGLGGVASDKKGLIIIEDTLVLGRLTATKHANGRDWWIISHKWNSDLYLKFLLTPDTLLGPFEQHIGSWVLKDDIVGQACFSPDGSKFCYVNRNYNFDYMKFDRCSGEFGSALNIVLDSNTTQGCAFSPNNRFLYINNFNEIYQFDTWASDFETSKILVDSIPFIQSGIPDWFAVQMLAPDNKIYLSTYNSIVALHVINNPDSFGIECGFERKGLKLPASNVYSIPNHPNYDLGPSPGSDTCEAIYTIAPRPSKNTTAYRIAPNPVSDWLNIIYQSNENALFELFDLYGNRVGATSLFHYFKNRLINVSNMPTGFYLAVVTCNGEKIWSEKVIVQH
jgi:hypothetical protein